MAVCQALGILSADRNWLPTDPAVVLLALGVGLGLQLRGGARGACALLVALAAGAVGLGERIDGAARFAPGPPRVRTLEGRVSQLARRAPGWTLDLKGAVGLDGLAPPHVRISGRDSEAAAGSGLERSLPGQQLRLRARLRRPTPLRNPGARDHEALQRRAGLAAQGSPVHPSLHAHLPERDGLRGWVALHRWREGVSRALGKGEAAGLLRALALGDRAGLSRDTRERLARLGVSHLLAVSGLHLAWVATLAFVLLRLGPVRWAWLAARADARWLALVGALLAAAAYALMAGWGIPVRRALLLLLALAMGVVAGRGRARAEPLALAALLILSFEPDALFAPGAQLSFAATAALLFAPRRAEPDGWLTGLVLTSATALLATAPLAALHFGSRAPFALATNLVAVPWTGVVLLPCALTSLLAASLSGLPGSQAILALGASLAAWTLEAARVASEWLPGVAAGPPPGRAWIGAAALVGIAGICSRAAPMRVAAAAAVALLLDLASPAPLSPSAPRALFLDVGQGDAVLVQGHSGAMLVDAGLALEGGPDLGRLAVVPALAALGIDALDLVVASHADLDHRGGLPAVLASVPVAEVWVPRGTLADDGFDALRAAAHQRGIRVRERGQGDLPGRYGDLVVTPLWPPRGSEGLSSNDRSLVLRVDLNGRRLLLPGDIEAGAEARLVASGADLRADVLKLAHHGSRSSSTPSFLAAVGAEVGVVSAPCWGRFGMPHARVLAASRAAGHSLWWTGRDGAVWLALEGPLRVSGSGSPRRCH